MRRPAPAKNPYLPFKGEIAETHALAPDVRLFRVRAETLPYFPGQFFMVSSWGAGEAPISVSSLYGMGDGVIEFCIRRVGRVTGALHELAAGDPLWLRGPYGRGFPLEGGGGEVLLAAGGMGIAPIRPLVRHFSGNGRKCIVLYGSKSPSEMVFFGEAEGWRALGAEVLLAVERCGREWRGSVGLVTGLLKELRADFPASSAYVCGPGSMIKAVMEDLLARGVSSERAFASIEAHMKCGVGKCGHCLSGGNYACTDGPVFSFAEMRARGLIF